MSSGIFDLRSEGQTHADRYLWLRSEKVSTDPFFHPFWKEFDVKLCREERMDALIDTWMVKAWKQGQL
jgi:hypothetical protein